MREIWRLQASLAVPGVILMGLGWGLGNIYLASAGALLLCGLVATLTIPRPPREPGGGNGDER